MGVCLLNLGLSLLYLFKFTDPLSTIFHEATIIASYLAAGHGFIGSGGLHIKLAPSAILQPVYPLLLAFFIFCFKIPYAFLAMRLLQVLINGLLCLTIYFIAREIFDRRAALFSALIFSVYLPFIHMTTIIWDTLLFTLLLSICVLLTIKLDIKSKVSAIWLGIALGVMVLTNSISLIYFPVLALYLLASYWDNRTKVVKSLVLVICLSAIMVFPWSARNMLLYRSFVPVRTGLWGILYLGNNPDATGTIWLKHQGVLPRSVDEGITLHFRPMINDLLLLNEWQEDQYFKNKFINYVKVHPWESVKMTFVKMYYFIWFNPYAPPSLFWTAQYLFILLFSIYGAVIARREKKNIALFGGLIVTFVIMYSILGVLYNFKYRMPIEPYLIVLAGYGVSRVVFWLRQ